MLDRDAEKYFAGLSERLAEAIRASDLLAEFRRSEPDWPQGAGIDSSDEGLALRYSATYIELIRLTACHHLERSKKMAAAKADGRIAKVAKTHKALASLRDRELEGLSPTFLSSLDDEIARLKAWIQAVKMWGITTARANFDYIAAGWRVTGTLRQLGISYAAMEAVQILWYVGYSELMGPIDVLDPQKTYATYPGKDARDAPERAAKDRWDRFEELGGKYRSLVVSSLFEGTDLPGWPSARHDWEPID